MNVGEVASAATGDENLASGLRIVFEEKDSSVALTGDSGAHETGRTGSEDDDVEFARSGGHCIDCRRTRLMIGVCVGLTAKDITWERSSVRRALRRDQ